MTVRSYGPEESATGADIGVRVIANEDVKGFIAQIKRDDDARHLSQAIPELIKLRRDERSQMGHLRDFPDGAGILIVGRGAEPSLAPVRDLPLVPTTKAIRRAAKSLSTIIAEFLDCEFGRRGWDMVDTLTFGTPYPAPGAPAQVKELVTIRV